jgi:hypothetical protein
MMIRVLHYSITAAVRQYLGLRTQLLYVAERNKRELDMMITSTLMPDVLQPLALATSVAAHSVTR